MQQYTQEQLIWLQQNNPEEYNRYVQAYNAAMAQAQAQVAQPAPVAQAVSHAVAAPATGGYDILAAANMAAECEDHSEIRSGGLARAGVAWLRLLSYIEIGVHPKKNPTHTPSQVVVMDFELHHPDHVTEYEGVRKPRIVTVRVPKTHGNNSGFPKFFKALQRAMGEQYQHIGQMLGQACLGQVYHNKDANGKTWENFDLDGAWSFSPTQFQNPSTGQTEQVTIPPLHGTPVMFSYDNERLLANPAIMKGMWDSIYVEGRRKIGGGATGKPEKEISNNYYQEQLMKSLNWETSQCKAVLNAAGCVTMTDEISAAKNTPTQAPAQQVTGAIQALPTLQAQPAQQVQAQPVATPQLQAPQAIAPTAPLAQLPPVASVPEVPAVLSATPYDTAQPPVIPNTVAPQMVAPVAQEAVPVQITPPVQTAVGHIPAMPTQPVMPQMSTGVAPQPTAQAVAPVANPIDPAAFMQQYA